LLCFSLACLSLTAHAERKVFNDDRSETKAIEVWRMTHDPHTRHHSVYHNCDPFNYDGRYLLYVIAQDNPTREMAGPRETFAVYDLMLDREIWRCPIAARWPIWAHRSNRVFWADGRKGRKQNVWQVEIPSGKMSKICDDALNAVNGSSPDDEWLFYTYNKVFRVRARPGSRSEVAWHHPEAPMVSSSLVCHNPTKPVYQVRQNIRILKNRPYRWSKKYPARMLVSDDGRMLGPALASIEQGHGAWLGSGEYIITGDGLIRGRRWNAVYPVPLLTYSNTAAHDPSPCGRSGQWTCSTDCINDTLKVFDWRTTDTTVVCYSCSIIHQPKGDSRDRSGPYDSDAHGSPDGTKIYFSTNYQIDFFPATVITAGSSGDTIGVRSTDGFPDEGVLSIHVGLVSYTGKTEISFTGLKRGALGSRVGPTPAGFTASNFYGRADKDAADPLAAQYSTDVYLAVVRLPDRPTLQVKGGVATLYPGYNHRETRGYHLYADGKRITDEPWSGRGGMALPACKRLQAKAVEWSGLTSELSKPVSTEGRLLALRCDPERPSELDEPVKQVLALTGNGQSTRASPNANERALPRALVRYTTGEGLPWAEEVYEHGSLVRRAELTHDGRATLVKAYDGGRVCKRTIRDPQNRLRRVEFLDTAGYLTRVEAHSKGKLVSIIDYEDREPVRKTVFAKSGQIVMENLDGYWQEQVMRERGR